MTELGPDWRAAPGPPPPASPLPADVPAMLREIEKLRRINHVLMDRVERSMDFQGSAFSLFQTAIVLESKVRERTRELEQALRELETSNAALVAAKAQAETAQARLEEAIESVNEGFALFDTDDRLVLCNATYRDLFSEVRGEIAPGMRFGEIAGRIAEERATLGVRVDPERWLSERLGQHAEAQGSHVHTLTDGRWIQINERRTRDGGVVGIYTDVTQLKEADARERARELAEKSILLQSTLDNIATGVCAWDRDQRLAAWNEPFVRLLNLPPKVVAHEATYNDFLEHNRALGDAGLPVGVTEWAHEAQVSAEPAHVRHAGRMLEIRKAAMPGGGLVMAFSDITELQEINVSLERRVAERTAAVTEANAKLQQEIIEREQVQDALREAKAAADEANLSKTKFLAAASHDLLQPLNAARLFVSALADQPLEGSSRRLVDQTDSALLSVEDLLEALLEISKLDAGVLQPQLTNFAVGDLLAAMKAEFAPIAAERGLDLRVVGSSAVVRSDARLLRRVLQNFISNALRYTRTGRVLVGCRRTAAGLRIEVADTGPGVPPDKADEIFQEFRRLDAQAHGRDRGVGLGLAIVDRASRMLGHPITLRSQVGRGSVFAIDVPRGALAARASIAPAPQPASPLSHARILVIDNEPTILDGMSALLRGWGCQVATAASQEEAMQLLADAEGPPDVILADYHLENGALGVEAIDAVRQAFACEAPGLIITADRAPEVYDQAAQRGLQILNKPVKPAKLRALLTQLLP